MYVYKMMPILTTMKFSWHGTEIWYWSHASIWNWKLGWSGKGGWETAASGGGASGKVSHCSSSSSDPSFSLTPVEYYGNEPFTLPNWVNSGNNDARKLCKQLKRTSTSTAVVVLVITIVMMVMTTMTL